MLRDNVFSLVFLFFAGKLKYHWAKNFNFFCALTFKLGTMLLYEERELELKYELRLHIALILGDLQASKCCKICYFELFYKLIAF